MESLITHSSKDYELIDSGDGKKLERFGDVVLARPDPQVLWTKNLPETEWKHASSRFEQEGSRGKWVKYKDIPEDWMISLEGVACNLNLSTFKHVGIFPEQSQHWKWLAEKIKEVKKENREVSVLNLFGYTGGASVACSLAGAHITHVDGSRGIIEVAEKNRDSSGLPKDAIRFIVDDVRKFVEREIKRGKTYDIILLDPPVYGKGSKKEVWKIEEDLRPFLGRVEKLFSKNPVALLLNGYASVYSHVTYKQLIEPITKKLSGNLESGELAIEESSGGRLLSCGIFARWSK